MVHSDGNQTHWENLGQCTGLANTLAVSEHEAREYVYHGYTLCFKKSEMLNATREEEDKVKELFFW